VLAAELFDAHVHGADVLPAIRAARKDGAAGAALVGGQRRQPRAVLAHRIFWCIDVGTPHLMARTLGAYTWQGARHSSMTGGPKKNKK
jgi:hypothetical protein